MSATTNLPKSKSLSSITLEHDVVIKLGDVFCGSWGYDQTNVNFYEIVFLSGKGTAYFRRMGTVAESQGRTHDNLVPCGPHRWDDKTYRCVVKGQKWGNSPAQASVKVDHVYCRPWSGQAQYATNSIYGH